MQRTLHDFAHGTAHAIERGIQQRIHYCVNCVLDLNDPDANRFETRIFMKKVRVVLKPVPGACNILACPRCHATHFTADFYQSGSQHHKRL